MWEVDQQAIKEKGIVRWRVDWDNKERVGKVEEKRESEKKEKKNYHCQFRRPTSMFLGSLKIMEKLHGPDSVLLIPTLTKIVVVFSEEVWI